MGGEEGSGSFLHCAKSVFFVCWSARSTNEVEERAVRYVSGESRRPRREFFVCYVIVAEFRWWSTFGTAKETPDYRRSFFPGSGTRRSVNKLVTMNREWLFWKGDFLGIERWLCRLDLFCLRNESKTFVLWFFFWSWPFLYVPKGYETTHGRLIHLKLNFTQIKHFLSLLY